MRDWRSEAGIRGGRLAKQLARRPSHASPSPGEIASTTPLSAPARPQSGQGKRPDASNNRPDGLSRTLPPPGAPAAAPARSLDQKTCARKACRKLFTPARPNQAYCPGDCRQRALEERKIEVLTDVLEELAGTAEELRQYSNGHNDPMYNRMVTLAEKAATALHTHRSKK